MPKCEQPGCGRELVSHPCHLAPYACQDPHMWCDRSEEEHRLCARVAELEAQLEVEKRRLRDPVEGCILRACWGGDGWLLSADAPGDDGETVAILAWPESWPGKVTEKQAEAFGFEVC